MSETAVAMPVAVNTAQRTWRRAALYVLFCLPFLALYWIVFRIQDDRASATQVLYMAFTNVSVPAVLGAGLWWVTGRLPVHAGSRIRFIVIHCVLLVLFVTSWTAWVFFLVSDIPEVSTRLLRYVLPWQSVIALCTYGLIVGISYTVRVALRARDLELLAERAERLRSQAELAALRAHINPHFLFNTLHTVTALLRSDTVMAEQALDRLSTLLRYALRLDRNEIELVTLEDEWEFVQGYLWLEQLRMGNRLHVESSFDDEALACAVPPFTLQPLVENAVRHGLAPRIGGGTLSVSAQERDGLLHIEVRDNGVGTPAETNGRGLGARAVVQRLQARHGLAATAESMNAPEGGYVVRLVIPAEGLPVGTHSLA